MFDSKMMKTDSNTFWKHFVFPKKGSIVPKETLFQRFIVYSNKKDTIDVRKAFLSFLKKKGVQSNPSHYLDIELVDTNFYKKYDIHRLLKGIPRETRLALQFDIEGLFSATSYVLSKRISKLIRRLPHIHEPATIVDANAACGGNSFAFVNDFDHVISIELHKERYKMLRHNLRVMNITTVDVLNRDCVSYLYKKRKLVDCIFFDPPWGGETYKEKCYVDLYLNGENIVDVSRTLLEKKKCTYVVIKAPNNIDRSRFTVFQTITYIDSFHKFLIIIIST